jgi:NADPH2:quinone reductase
MRLGDRWRLCGVLHGRCPAVPADTGASFTHRGRFAAGSAFHGLGERFLVHGGTSGVGVTAIQLARCHGAEVFTTAGTAEKCRFCEKLGAHAIHYKEQDFVEEIRSLTEGQGVDVVLDIVGGDYLQRNLACLAVEGRLLQIACQNGFKTDLNLLPVMLKRLTLTGSTLRSRSVADKALIAASLCGTVWPWLAAGRVRPVLFRTLPLAYAAEAHRIMESGQHLGKLVLEVGES